MFGVFFLGNLADVVGKRGSARFYVALGVLALLVLLTALSGGEILQALLLA